MAATKTSTEPTALQPLFDFAFLGMQADAFARVQQQQLEAFLAWQQSIAALNKELWDEWICRWAGGVPLDA